MDPATLQHLDRFFDAHGPFRVKVGKESVMICIAFPCDNCVLFTPQANYLFRCPIRYDGSRGRLSLNYLPYIQQRYPEHFI